MKDLIRIIIFVPELLRYLYYVYKHRTVDYFQYETLVKAHMRIPRIRRFRTNLLYGNYFAIKNLSREISLFHDVLEHGISFCQRSGICESTYINLDKRRNIYTYSDYRKKIIQSYGISQRVVTVGPYIIGASFFHNQERRRSIKERFGKILLVFPVHSLRDLRAEYDIRSLIDEIVRIQCHFQSVFICLHYVDILNNRHLRFEKLGFTIVSAGSQEDIWFLSRLKDLIILSDMTMSNAMGTHIGYSISMNKPHYFFCQSVDYTANGTIHTYQSSEAQEKEKLSPEFIKLFGEFSWNISREQIDICKYYWGNFNRY